MQKHAVKMHLGEDDTSVSDGYHVFIALICTVVVMISCILLAFAVEMLS